MSGWRSMLGAVVVSSLAAGCGGAPPTPAAASKLTADQPVTAALPAQKPAAPRVMPKVPEPGPPLAPLQYEAKGRRDPFTPVPVAKEKSGLDVSTTRLVGVIRGRQLMALVEASDGLGYILRPGDVLGNGRVVGITPGSVTFAVAGRAGQRDTSLTLRLVRE